MTAPLPSLTAFLGRTLVRALAAGILVAGISLFISSEYRSTASILPDSQNEQASTLMAAAATLGVRAPRGADDPGLTFPEILNSHWLAERLVTTPFDFTYRTGLVGPWHHQHETLKSYLGFTQTDRAIQALPGILSVRRDIKSGTLTLSAETKSAELSQQVVRTALALLEEFLTERKNTHGKVKAEFVRARIKDAEGQAQAAENALREFLARNKNYRLSGDPGIQLTGARLEAGLVLRRQVVATLTLNLEQALQEEKDRIPTLSILDNGNLPEIKSRPSRALLVLFAMILAGAASLAWDGRRHLLARLQALVPS